MEEAVDEEVEGEPPFIPSLGEQPHERAGHRAGMGASPPKRAAGAWELESNISGVEEIGMEDAKGPEDEDGDGSTREDTLQQSQQSEKVHVEDTDSEAAATVVGTAIGRSDCDEPESSLKCCASAEDTSFEASAVFEESRLERLRREAFGDGEEGAGSGEKGLYDGLCSPPRVEDESGDYVFQNGLGSPTKAEEEDKEVPGRLLQHPEDSDDDPGAAEQSRGHGRAVLRRAGTRSLEDAGDAPEAAEHSPRHGEAVVRHADARSLEDVGDDPAAAEQSPGHGRPVLRHADTRSLGDIGDDPAAAEQSPGHGRPVLRHADARSLGDVGDDPAAAGQSPGHGRPVLRHAEIRSLGDVGDDPKAAGQSPGHAGHWHAERRTLEEEKLRVQYEVESRLQKAELDRLRLELERRGDEEAQHRRDAAALRAELAEAKGSLATLRDRSLGHPVHEDGRLEDALHGFSAPPMPDAGLPEPPGNAIRTQQAGSSLSQPPPSVVAPPPPRTLRYFRECSKDEADLQASVPATEQPKRGDQIGKDAELVWLKATPPVAEGAAPPACGGAGGGPGIKSCWSERPLRVQVLTWNLGNKAPNEGDVKYMVPEHGRGLDVVAVGLQEAAYAGSGSHSLHSLRGRQGGPLSGKARGSSGPVCSKRRNAKPFPAGLGPFGVVQQTILPKLDPAASPEGMRSYTLARQREVEQLTQAGIHCGGLVSEPFEISCSTPWRLACTGFGVPEGTVVCAWAYPMDASRGDFAKAGLSPSATSLLEENTDCAILFQGGILFLDGDGECVGALALCRGEDLTFAGPHLQVPGGFLEELQAAGAFRPVAKAALRDSGAESFAWIKPGEQFEDGRRCEFGGFVYLLRDPAQPPRCFFIRGPGDTASPGGGGRAGGGSASVTTCSAFSEHAHHEEEDSSSGEDFDRPLEAPCSNGNAQHPFVQMLAGRLGDEWRLVASAHLMEMHLDIFVRTELEVSRVEKSWAATGVGNVVGNKGGLVICLNVQNNSFCFINSHLAAHASNVQRRNEDCQHILRHARVRYRVLDAASQFDHCFWFGDLNYRLDFSDSADVLKLLDQDLFGRLLAKDQLRNQQHNGTIFAGFLEGEPTFAPTFKLERRAGLAYSKQRVPSYCDRILWRSLPHCDGGVRQTRLSAIAEAASSDHKPVCAHFEVAPSSCPTDAMLLGAEAMADAVAIYVVRLEADGLRACDITGRSDPYIVFHSVPAALVGRCDPSSRQTRVKTQTLHPEWSPGDVPVLRAAVAANGTPPVLLRHCTLALDMYDRDLFKGDDPLGTALISLAPTDKIKPDSTRYTVDFKAPVILANERCGHVRGRLLVCFSPEDAVRANAGANPEVAARKCCTLS